MQPICDEYKLGKTEATLFPITWYELPLPTQDSYKPWSVSKVCGNMTAKGYGFPSSVWTFSYLSQPQIQQIFALFDEEKDASVPIYIRTYKDIGAVREAADFSAILYRPVDGSGAALMPKSAFHWANVQVRFAHLVEL